MSKLSTLLPALTLGAAVLASFAFTESAEAQHEVQAYLSKSGLDFIAKEAPSYLPKTFYPPSFSKSFACLDFEQRQTTINLAIDDLKIYSPSDGRLRVDVNYSGGAHGELFINNFYACFGTLTCQDTLSIRSGSASFDFEVVVRNGRSVVESRNSTVTLAPSNVDFNLSDCGMTGEVLNSGISFGEEWILGALEAKLTSLATDNLAPMLQDMLDGFRTTGDLALATYNADLTDVRMEGGGVFLRMLADVGDNFAPAACVAEYDEGGPVDFDGPEPDLSNPNASHASLALNLGLVNKGLYTIWRRGLLCLTSEHVRALGVELDLDMVGAMLPGFPAGTKFSFDVTMTDYPRVVPTDSKNSQVTVKVEGLVLNLHGDRPDGSRNTLHVELDVKATATVGINPADNAIFATLDAAEITRLVLEDERKATGAGFDVARIMQMIHNYILPDLLQKIGPLPLTGPAFSFEGYAVILRELRTSNAFMKVGIDLFKIPEVDVAPPETKIVEYPTGPVNPASAVIRVQGSDTQIPSELLQFALTVDGEAQDPSFMHSFNIGEAGVTKTYQVQVAAIDLSGNTDETPATAEITVDGIVPHVSIDGRRVREADQGPVAISWQLSDDLSAASSMNVRVEVYVLDDPTDALSARLIDTQELAAGATNTTVALQQMGGLYRVEVHVMDEAGNDSTSSLLLTIPSSGGCSVAGPAGTGNLALLLLALGALLARRRRSTLVA